MQRMTPLRISFRLSLSRSEGRKCDVESVLNGSAAHFHQHPPTPNVQVRYSMQALFLSWSQVLLTSVYICKKTFLSSVVPSSLDGSHQERKVGLIVYQNQHNRSPLEEQRRLHSHRNRWWLACSSMSLPSRHRRCLPLTPRQRQVETHSQWILSLYLPEWMLTVSVQYTIPVWLPALIRYSGFPIGGIILIWELVLMEKGLEMLLFHLQNFLFNAWWLVSIGLCERCAFMFIVLSRTHLYCCSEVY